MIKNKKGFTLIELIIVMAIIGILAVVAIVAISGKTIDARNARRMADIGAIRTAMAVMCADADTFTCAVDAANAEARINTCTGEAYISFANIQDPDNDGTACTDAADDIGCDYGVTVVDEGTDVVDPCDYDMYVAMEQTGTAVTEATDRRHVTQDGITVVD